LLDIKYWYRVCFCCRFSPWNPNVHEEAKTDMLTRKVKSSSSKTMSGNFNVLVFTHNYIHNAQNLVHIYYTTLYRGVKGKRFCLLYFISLFTFNPWYTPIITFYSIGYGCYLWENSLDLDQSENPWCSIMIYTVCFLIH
jgi:hypothetical protein